MQNKKSFTALDIGSRYIKLLVATSNMKDHGKLWMQGVCVPSLGIRNGVVSDKAKLEDSILRAKERLREKTGLDIESAFSVFNTEKTILHIETISKNIKGSPYVLSTPLLNSLKKTAMNRTNRLYPGGKIIDLRLNSFSVDGEDSLDIFERDSVKAYIEYKASYTGTIVSDKNHERLLESIEPVIDPIQKIVPPGFFMMSELLSEEQKEIGTVLADIGANTTTLIFWKDSAVVGAKILPTGVVSIIQEISLKLAQNMKESEKILLQYQTQGVDKKTESIIEKSTKTLLKTINDTIKDFDSQKIMPGGVVFCGGGAINPNLLEMAKKEIGLFTSFAPLPDRLSHLSAPASVWGSAYGTLLWQINMSKNKGQSGVPSWKKILGIFS